LKRGGGVKEARCASITGWNPDLALGGLGLPNKKGGGPHPSSTIVPPQSLVKERSQGNKEGKERNRKAGPSQMHEIACCGRGY